MTRRLFWEDPYMKEFNAHVLSVSEDGVVLDATAFYPTGGGQPNDTGNLSFNGTTVRVVDVVKQGDDILHLLDGPAQFSAGAAVHGTIDWERRYAHMRYHTAIHIIDGIVATRHSSQGMLTGSQIYQDRARFDIDVEDFTREFVESVVQEANQVTHEDHRVYQRLISREEALRMPGLARTEPGKELLNSLETVRTIVIEGLDEQADGGTHVSNTREVGTIRVTKIQSKGKRNKRVEFVLE